MANSTYVLGLMSGTSVDALDLCYCQFDPNYNYKILAWESYAYPVHWARLLSQISQQSGKEIAKIDAEFGSFLGQQCLRFLAKHNLNKLDFIASHGHTVFHNPQEQYTLQIGSGAAIYAKTQIPVICDFRKQDVALGGQGAPLVPIGDELLFAAYDSCLNLGGFANISFQQKGKRVAFDVCILNLILNRLSKQLNLDFDENGKIAASGTINYQLLADLNGLPYYKQLPPKSLGIEFYFDCLKPLLAKHLDSTANYLRTFVAHCSTQIANTLNNHNIKNTLITGGGAYNEFLIAQIRQKTNCQIVLPKPKLIEMKEALIFAFLGYLKSKNQNNVLASVTGAKKDHSSGVCFGFG